MANSEDAFVHARFAGGESRLVGRYRHVVPDTGRSHGEFEYAGSWVQNVHGCAFALDPANLPLSNEIFVTTKRTGLFGPLADTTPDTWGRRLARLEGPNAIFSPIDWLFATGDDRVGCLAFSRTPTLTGSHSAYLGVVSLTDIAIEFDKILQKQPANPLAEHIYRAGKSIGGARPKAIVEMDSELWIAKFQKHDDLFDQCEAEHATMKLAQLCGINAAQTRLVDVGPRRAVLIKRFDRTDGPDFHPTLHFLSAMSLLNLDDTSDEGSYAEIATELLHHGMRQREDRVELFRRMVFNVLCGNRDDHLKNHALTYHDAGWSLSPAFDVLPQPDFDRMQAIGVGRFGANPTIENCLSRCDAFGLSMNDARSAITDMVAIMKRWRTIYRDLGVAQDTIDHIDAAFSLRDVDR